MAEHTPCNHCRLATSEAELEKAAVNLLHYGNEHYNLKLTHYRARQLARVTLGLDGLELRAMEASDERR